LEIGIVLTVGEYFLIIIFLLGKVVNGAKMSIIFKKFINREYIKNNPTKYFVFGDNDMRVGTGGQAKEMRGEPNSIGVRVKKYPGNISIAYYSDIQYDFNVIKITEDFDIVKKYLKGGCDVVIPEDKIGTGLAKLKVFAPKTLKFINDKIKELCDKYGVKQED